MNADEQMTEMLISTKIHGIKLRQRLYSMIVFLKKKKNLKYNKVG